MRMSGIGTKGGLFVWVWGRQEAGRDKIEHDIIMESRVTTLEEGGRRGVQR